MHWPPAEPYGIVAPDMVHGAAEQGEIAMTAQLRASGRRSINTTDLESTLTQSPTESYDKALVPLRTERTRNTTSTVHFRTMEWWNAGALMIAETISLGILALPGALAKVGLIPGILLIIVLGIFATYSGLVIAEFERANPWIQNFTDAGEILWGKFGRYFMLTNQQLFLMFIMAAHIVTFSVLMNVLTKHGLCTIAFSTAGLLISILCTLPRKLSKVSYLSMVSCISILSAVLTVMISLAVKNRGKVADSYELARWPGLREAVMAILNITIAYTGNVAFLSFIHEMREPRDFKKSLMMLQGSSVSLYVLVASFIYCFVGASVPSPALGAASYLIQCIAYGLAIATVIIAGVVNASVAIKTAYRWIWRHKPDVVSENSSRAVISWIILVVLMWLTSWILAEIIPIFENLLAFISALFGSWFTFGFSGFLWLQLHRGSWLTSPRQICLTILNVFMIILAAALCGFGLWSSGKGMTEGPGRTKPFSCNNNAPLFQEY